MKTYTKPEIEINALNNADAVANTRSGGIAYNNGFFTQDKGYNVVDNF